MSSTAPPPAYGSDVPGYQSGDPPLEDIIGPGEIPLMVTRPSDPQAVGKFTWWRFMGPMVAIPCFWIHALIMCPCALNVRWAAVRSAEKSILVLTDRAVYGWSGDTQTCCCCPGACTTGARTTSVPLERITNVNLRRPGQGCVNSCISDIECLEIETAGAAGPRAELMLVGATDSEEFKRRVLEARQSDRVAPGGSASAVTTVQPMATSASPQMRLKVRLNSNPSKVKIVLVHGSTEGMHKAIADKFDLPAETKMRIFLTEDGIEVDGIDELSADDNITVCLGAEQFTQQ